MATTWRRIRITVRVVVGPNFGSNKKGFYSGFGNFMVVNGNRCVVRVEGGALLRVDW